MKIGIIGAGNVGGALGTRFAQGGHEVVFGSRHPESKEMTELTGKAGPTARAASTALAAASSDVLILATPWGATKSVLDSAGDLTGKTLLDATNPLLPDLSGLELGRDFSGAEQVAAWAPGAKVVKIFNSVGYNIMTDPSFHGVGPVMFYCGDDPDAKTTAAQLATELGFDAVYAGPLKQARLLEPFALLWVTLALFYGQGREIGFKLLRR